MRWTRWGTALDARIGGMAERAARRLSRRDALHSAVVGGAAGLASLALGHKPAGPEAAQCHCGPTRRCTGCPGAGCPHDQHLCKGSSTGSCFNNQGYRCEWPSGTWIACMNLGNGYGYKVCYDCIGKAGCPDWCTCLSQCICCDCLTARDLKAEQRRLQAAGLPG
jgi:hypothetical protein